MKWKLAAGLVLSALFLWLAFRKAQLDEILHALSEARYELLVPIVFLTLVSFAMRAWRWHYLLSTVRSISFPPLFASTMIGFMGNNVLPARLGELLRAHSLGRSTGVSRSAALASVVVERFFDIGILLLLFGGVLVFRGLPEDIRAWGIVLFVVTLPLLFAIILFEARPDFFLRWLERTLPGRVRARALDVATNFREGLGSLGHGGALLGALFTSALTWACLVGVVVLCFEALHLRLPASAGVVTLMVMAIGTMIPSAPGYIGTLQYAGTLALVQYGIDPSRALSFTILYHASQWVPVTAIGLGYFLREQVGLRRLPDLASSGDETEVPIEEPKGEAGRRAPGARP